MKKSIYTFISACAVIVGMLVIAPSVVYADTISDLQARVESLKAIVATLQAQVQALLASRNAGTVTVPVPKSTLVIRSLPDAVPSTVVAGSQKGILGKFLIDASGAPEDVSLTLQSFTLELNAPANNSQKALKNCEVMDGDKSLTSSYTINPVASFADASLLLFTVNNDKREISLGKESLTLAVACDVTAKPEAAATFAWNIKDINLAARLVPSGTAVTPVYGAKEGRKVTLITEGSFVVEVDASSPSSQNVAGGSREIPVTVFDLYAAGEAVLLETLGLQIDGPNPFAVSKYSIWDGGTKITEGGFNPGERNTVVSFASGVLIPKDSHKLITVKVDFANAGPSEKAQVGDTIAVNYNGSDGNFNLTRGLGKSSGRFMNPSSKTDTKAAAMTITSSSAATISTPAAVTVYEKLPVPTNGLLSGLMAMYRFKITAGAEDQTLTSMRFTVEPSEVALNDLKLFAFTDKSFSAIAFRVNPVGRRLGPANEKTTFDMILENAGYPLVIPAGQTYYFELRGITSGKQALGYIKTSLQGLGEELLN